MELPNRHPGISANAIFETLVLFMPSVAGYEYGLVLAGGCHHFHHVLHPVDREIFDV